MFGQPLAIYKQLARSTALDECFLHLNNSEPFVSYVFFLGAEFSKPVFPIERASDVVLLLDLKAHAARIWERRSSCLQQLFTDALSLIGRLDIEAIEHNRSLIACSDGHYANNVAACCSCHTKKELWMFNFSL